MLVIKRSFIVVQILHNVTNSNFKKLYFLQDLEITRVPSYFSIKTLSRFGALDILTVFEF